MRQVDLGNILKIWDISKRKVIQLVVLLVIRDLRKTPRKSKNSLKEIGIETQITNMQKLHKNIERNTTIKIILTIIDEGEWQKGRGFMKRVKERWGANHQEHATARDTASRFKIDHEIMNC